MKTEYIQLSEKQTQKAKNIINCLNLFSVWKKYNAEVNYVGSIKIGVLAKHRDIDLHLYTDELNIQESFKAIAELCANPNVKKCNFVNLANTDENCFEWHLWYEDEEKHLWQIDMIQIKRGSLYDGYFENVAKKICHQMSEQHRETILKLKYETPDNMKICGIEYYKAVIQDNVQTFDELIEWQKNHSFEGIIEW